MREANLAQEVKASLPFLPLAVVNLLMMRPPFNGVSELVCTIELLGGSLKKFENPGYPQIF